MLSWLEELIKACQHLLSANEQQNLQTKKIIQKNSYFLNAWWAFFRKIQASYLMKFKKKKKFKIKKFKRKVFIEENEPFETEEYRCQIPEYHFHRYLKESAEELPSQLLFSYPVFLKNTFKLRPKNTSPSYLKLRR